MGGNRDDGDVAAPVFGGQAVLLESDQYLVRICARQVHFVHGDDDWDVGRLGVVDRFDGLGHHAVVSGDDEHGDIRRLGAACPHGCKRLVSRGVQERDGLVADSCDGSSDVLGDSAGFA